VHQRERERESRQLIVFGRKGRQLELYKRLFDALATDDFDYPRFYSHLDMDPDTPFSDAFQSELAAFALSDSGHMSEVANRMTLGALCELLRERFLTVGKSEMSLELVYRYRDRESSPSSSSSSDGETGGEQDEATTTTPPQAGGEGESKLSEGATTTTTPPQAGGEGESKLSEEAELAAAIELSLDNGDASTTTITDQADVFASPTSLLRTTTRRPSSPEPEETTTSEQHRREQRRQQQRPPPNKKRPRQRHDRGRGSRGGSSRRRIRRPETAEQHRHRRVSILDQAGTIIGVDAFDYDSSALDVFLADMTQFWSGEREPRGVEIDEVNKCR
jgi:hypothetical protein